MLACCAPGRTRTFDLRIRNPLLYPAELRAQDEQRHIPRFATNETYRSESFVLALASIAASGAPPLAAASMANTEYYFIKLNTTGEAVGSVGAAVLEWAWKAERRGQ
jgi:hypothetical protein